jgi:ubiquitin carboxyl-terminal hydrolase 48
MYDNALNPNSEFPNDDTPLALVPVVFVRAWRQWLSQPTEMLRPDSIHNTPFICEHQMLAVDPNCSSDWEGTHVLIKRADWDALEKL